MIAHVAEAGEARGRVILRIARAPDAAAIRTAVRFARAFKAELEGLFVEDTNLMTLCGHPFAKLFDGPGRALRGIDERRMRDAFRAAGPEAVAGFRKVLEQMMDADMKRHYLEALEAGR